MLCNIKTYIFFFLISCTYSYAQRIPENVIDTFAIRTGKIILYENNKWEYVDDSIKDTIKTANSKNYFDSEMLLNQDKSPYQKPLAKNNKKTEKKNKKNKGKKEIENSDGAALHIIKRGDTLMKIARQHGISVNTLFQLNNLTKSSRLSIGQKIKLQ